MLFRFFIVCVCLLATFGATLGVASRRGQQRMERDKSKITAMLTAPGNKMDTYETTDYLNYLGASYKDSRMDDVDKLIGLRRQEPTRCADLSIFDRLAKKYEQTPLSAYIKWEQYQMSTFCRHFAGPRLAASRRKSGHLWHNWMANNNEFELWDDTKVHQMLVEPNMKGEQLPNTVIYWYLRFLDKDYRNRNFGDANIILAMSGHIDGKWYRVFCDGKIFNDMLRKHKGRPMYYYILAQEARYDAVCRNLKAPNPFTPPVTKPEEYWFDWNSNTGDRGDFELEPGRIPRNYLTDKQITLTLTKRGRRIPFNLVYFLLKVLGRDFRSAMLRKPNRLNSFRLDDVGLLIDMARRSGKGGDWTRDTCHEHIAEEAYEQLKKKYKFTALFVYVQQAQGIAHKLCPQGAVHGPRRPPTRRPGRPKGRQEAEDQEGYNSFPGMQRDKQKITAMLVQKGPSELGLDKVIIYLRYLGKGYRDSNLVEVDTLLFMLEDDPKICQDLGTFRQLREKYDGSRLADLVKYAGEDIEKACEKMKTKPSRSRSLW